MSPSTALTIVGRIDLCHLLGFNTLGIPNLEILSFQNLIKLLVTRN